MTLTLETIISETHKVGTTPGKHGMTLTLETIISESHTKSGNNTWKTWDDVDSRDHGNMG